LQTTIGQRFTLFLKKKKISQKVFSKATGLAEKNVSNIATDHTKYPRSDFFAAVLENYPDLNLRWLILGKGEMWLNETGTSGQSKESELKEKVEKLEKEVLSLKKMEKKIVSIGKELEELNLEAIATMVEEMITNKKKEKGKP